MMWNGRGDCRGIRVGAPFRWQLGDKLSLFPTIPPGTLAVGAPMSSDSPFLRPMPPLPVNGAQAADHRVLRWIDDLGPGRSDLVVAARPRCLGRARRHLHPCGRFAAMTLPGIGTLYLFKGAHHDEGRVMLRFYVDENRRHRGSFWEWLLEQANAKGIRWVSAFRRPAGSVGITIRLHEPISSNCRFDRGRSTSSPSRGEADQMIALFTS